MNVRTVSRHDLEDLTSRALVAGRVPEGPARDVAEFLVLADLFGIHTHGVQRVPQYLSRSELRGVDVAAEPEVTRLAPALALVDGHNALGPLVGATALAAAREGARSAGIGAAFAQHSNHFGPIMPYLYEAAGEGFAAIIASNATTTIAPWGGKQTKVGNNPLGWGVPHPRGGDPVMLDVALSVAARAKIRAAAAAGTTIPDTWATDADGRPTTDPTQALEGFLLPVGDHKGYGLSVMVDLFAGVLSGAAYLDRVSSWSVSPGQPQNLGHLFVLIDTRLLAPADALAERMDDFRNRLLSTPAVDPATPVQLPGQREMTRFHTQLADGIELDLADIEALEKLADG